jgi:hypothetical protein
LDSLPLLFVLLPSESIAMSSLVPNPSGPSSGRLCPQLPTHRLHRHCTGLCCLARKPNTLHARQFAGAAISGTIRSYPEGGSGERLDPFMRKRFTTNEITNPHRNHTILAKPV